MANVTAAFDASGAEHDQPWLVVAGFVGRAKGWVKFSEDWTRQIAPMPAFHAAPYRNQVGDDEYERGALVPSLVGLIKGQAEARFNVAIRIANLDLLSEETRARFNLSAYLMAGWTAAVLVQKWAFFRGHAWKDILMVYEKGDLHWEKLREGLERTGLPALFLPKADRTDQRGAVVEPGFVPLQAADLFAHELFRALKRGRTEHIGPVLAELRDIPGQSHEWTPQNLIELENDVKTFPPLVRFGQDII
jgi:hypothetical protein